MEREAPGVTSALDLPDDAADGNKSFLQSDMHTISTVLCSDADVTAFDGPMQASPSWLK